MKQKKQRTVKDKNYWISEKQLQELEHMAAYSSGAELFELTRQIRQQLLEKLV